MNNNYIYEENKEEQLRLDIGMDLWMRIAKFNLSKWRAVAVTCVVQKCVAMPVNIIIIIIICKCKELYDDVAVPNAMSCANDAGLPTTNYAAHSGMVKIN